MKFLIKQENIHKALSAVGKISSNRTELPILSNVLIKTVDGLITFTTTNLETAITHETTGKIIEEGSITAPAKLLSEFVASLPNTNIEMEVTDTNIRLKTEDHSCLIKGVSAEDFPVIPTISSGQEVVVDGDTLKKTLQSVFVASSNDDSRPILNGVCFYENSGALVVVATDSYRLSEITTTIKITEPLKTVIPNQTISETLRLIKPQEKVTVTFSGSQVQITTDESTIISKTLDGNYPEYRKLIPEASEVVATLNKHDLLSAAKVASVFARESAGSIQVTINQNNLSVSSVASQAGENSTNLSVEGSGEGSVTLNSRYLIDTLGVISAEEVVIEFSSNTNPVVVKPVQGQELHIIMPLKT